MNNLPSRIVHPGEASVYDHLGGEKMTILLSAKDTGGALAMFIDHVPPGGGPPLHIHHNEDETFYILEGELDIQVNHDRFTARSGTSAFLPKGIPHTFANFGMQPVKALVVLSPAGLEGLFAEVEPLAIQEEPDMPADKRQLVLGRKQELSAASAPTLLPKMAVNRCR